MPYYLTDYQISSNITSIGVGAFAGSPLSNIVIPDSVTSIGEDAFANSAVTEILIPDSVTHIGDYAFYGCQQLTEIELSDNLTAIGEYVFADSAITEILIPDSVTEIGEYAFVWCEQLTEIEIPDSVTHIGNCAFSGCQQLTEIKLPEGLKQISNGSFEGCTALSRIVIPDSVTEIEERAFFYCSALSTVVYGGASVQWSRIQIGENNGTLEEATVQCAEASQCLAFVYEWNMSICSTDNIVYFYVVALTEDEDLQFEVTVGNNEKLIYELSELEIYNRRKQLSDGNTYIVYSVPVHVAITEMRAPIQIRAVLGNVTDTMTGYSARLYCETLINENDRYYSPVAEKLLRYASAVQTYFGDMTYGLADEGITQNTDIELYVNKDCEISVETEGTLPVRYYGASVVFEENLKLRFYFVGEVTEDLKGNDCGPDDTWYGLVTEDNGFVIKDGYCYCDVGEFDWSAWQNHRSFCIFTDENNYVTVDYHLLWYVERMLAKDNVDPDFANLLNAVIDLWAAARASLQE